MHFNLANGGLLIDTAHASNNERILAEAVQSFDTNEMVVRSNTRGGRPTTEELEPVHVVTKVWYTYLGYERTKISVQESLKALGYAQDKRQIYVHMLLHWPRCNDNISWMNCEEEEENLPQEVKDAGPPPHLNKDTAFLNSWKALEDIWLENQQAVMKSHKSPGIHPPLVVSIGVSNFELEDMRALMETGPRVPPMIYQGNVWLVFHDPLLMDYLREQNIFFQAYAVMNGILQRKDDSPRAYGVLSRLASEIMAMVHSSPQSQDGGPPVEVTEASVLLAYFIHRNIGVIPRSASPDHQRRNAPPALAAVLPHLTPSHIERLEIAVPALMRGEDPHAAISFKNTLSVPIQIHWLNPNTNEEVLVSEIVQPGSVEIQRSQPGHRFVAYDPERSIRREFLVDVDYGGKQHFSVEADEL